LGTWESQVLAPTQVNYQDTFIIRLEIIPPEINASTPVPGSTVRESAQISAYNFMGAELKGIDLEQFDVLPVDSRYFLKIRDDEVNYWEWQLRPKGQSAAGLRSVAVRLFLPAIKENGITIEEEIKLYYVSLEVIPGQTTDAASLAMVRSAETVPTQGFSVMVANEDTLAILFTDSTTVDDMSIATSMMDVLVLDAFPDFEETELEADSCIYFVREGREPTLPPDCNPAKTFDRSLVAGDVFWYDGFELLEVTVRKNGMTFPCPTSSDRCNF
jgi:hypothetical protein